MLKYLLKNVAKEYNLLNFPAYARTGLWGLVNNAGICTSAAASELLTKDDFAKPINVNLLGLIDVTLHLLPLIKKNRGRVVNVASVMGRFSIIAGGYCPAKYGVEAFSDSLRREMDPFGVKVSIIEPGGFLTSIGQKLVQEAKNVWDQVPSHIKESYGQQYYEKRSQALRRFLQNSNKDLYLVTDCMEHALTSCSPRTRYSAGWDAKLLFIPLSYLPTSLADFVVTRHLPKPAGAV